MTAPTLTINAGERDALHGLMLHRLFVLGEEPIDLARAEGVGVEQLGEEFGEDLRLMQDLGWLFESDSEAVALTVPAGELVRTLKRLRRDARRAPCEERRESYPSRRWSAALAAFLHDRDLVGQEWVREGAEQLRRGELIER